MSGVTVSGNTLVANNHVVANFTNINGQLTINFVSNNGTVATNAIVNTIMQGIQYSNGSHNLPSAVTLSYVFNDGMATGSTSTVTNNVLVNINRVNNAPINLIPADQAVSQNGQLIFSATNNNPIVIQDIDANIGNITVTLTAAIGSGVLNITDPNNLTTIVANNTNNVSITGNINNC